MILADFAKFNSEKYNTLPKVDVASSILLHAPAFITSADFPNEQVYPAGWLLENDNKLSAFEYSTDVQVKRTLEKLIKNSSIFLKFCELIKEYHLENSLAPCITARDSLQPFEKRTGFLETTYLKSDASIVKNNKDQAVCCHENASIITTLWAYPVNDHCFSGGNHNHSLCSLFSLW
ncbi:4507_t:CDS:2 [Ambispora leptoticha]|uniref:4507_t:CDS:1 n=1 Tax=Ambispora leptoticha TaxID=144679 RepID=A0A9N9G5A9_9GLOM|nr:4507_t:CDS:2 [Ambispora leptoticha]